MMPQPSISGAPSHQIVRVPRHVRPVKATQSEMDDARSNKGRIEAWQLHWGLQTSESDTVELDGLHHVSPSALQQLQWHLAGSDAKGEVATDFHPPLHPYTHP